MFNVTITLDGTARFDGERERIIVAAGEFPDTGAPCCLNTLTLYEDQVIRSLPEDMLRTHAPDYSRAMDERYPAIWTIYKAADMEGEQMAMGAIAEGSMASVFHLFTRKDWLDALGVELPDYDETKTFLARGIHYYENDALSLDWLENLLVAYRDGDPDGNGKNDTIPYGAYTQGAQALRLVAVGSDPGRTGRADHEPGPQPLRGRRALHRPRQPTLQGVHGAGGALVGHGPDRQRVLHHRPRRELGEGGDRCVRRLQLQLQLRRPRCRRGRRTT